MSGRTEAIPASFHPGAHAVALRSATGACCPCPASTSRPAGEYRQLPARLLFLTVLSCSGAPATLHRAHAHQPLCSIILRKEGEPGHQQRDSSSHSLLAKRRPARLKQAYRVVEEFIVQATSQRARHRRRPARGAFPQLSPDDDWRLTQFISNALTRSRPGPDTAKRTR